MENYIKMIKPGDRVLALDYCLWEDGESFDPKNLLKSATVVEIRPCENVPEDMSYRTLVDIYFDHRGLARSYFIEQLVRR